MKRSKTVKGWVIDEVDLEDLEYIMECAEYAVTTKKAAESLLREYKTAGMDTFDRPRPFKMTITYTVGG